MHDRVMGFLRETLLHENLFGHLSVRLIEGVVKLRLIQPHPTINMFPDPELVLTFSGVRECSAARSGAGEPGGEDLLGIECTVAEGAYTAVAEFGRAGGQAEWSVRIVFAGLRYRRLNGADQSEDRDLD